MYIFRLMNIFVLDSDPITAAHYHCDKHVVKMVLETAQILCTTNHMLGCPAPYMPTHIQHPCRIWSEKTLGNWLWLQQLGLGLAKEYTVRYKKQHKCEYIICQMPAPKKIDNSTAITPFVQCMPDKYKTKDNPVAAYRNYYSAEKYTICTYTRAPWPEWLKPQN